MKALAVSERDLMASVSIDISLHEQAAQIVAWNESVPPAPRLDQIPTAHGPPPIFRKVRSRKKTSGHAVRPDDNQEVRE